MLLALFAMAIAIVVEGSKFDFLLVVGVGAFGFFIPRFVLKRMIRNRQQPHHAGACRTRSTSPSSASKSVWRSIRP